MNIWIDIIFLFILYMFVFYKTWKKQGKQIFLVKTIMYIYLGFVLHLTLMPVLVSLPFVFNHPYHPMNLIPFAGVINNRMNFIRPVGFNVILTIPFGFLLPHTMKCRKKNLFLKTVLSTFLLSLSIELLQPLLHDFRVADVTDLITNTTGGVIGYMFYLVLITLLSKTKNNKNHYQ